MSQDVSTWVMNNNHDKGIFMLPVILQYYKGIEIDLSEGILSQQSHPLHASRVFSHSSRAFSLCSKITITENVMNRTTSDVLVATTMMEGLSL